MQEITLSKRLGVLASMVEPCDTVTDVGCDHGLLALWLIDKGICKKAAASDINRGPLDTARANAKAYGIQADRIDFILSDGLLGIAPFEKGFNTLVIAGMGGLLIKEILEKSRDKAKLYEPLILSPHTKQYELRRYLTENGYIITDERYVCEDEKLYVMIKACHARGQKTEPYSETELRFGRFTGRALEDKETADFFKARCEELGRLEGKEGLPEERRRILSEEAECYREVLRI